MMFTAHKNYEETWHASNHRAHELVKEEYTFGDIRKMVAHNDHQEPKEIGVSEEFLEWLTDPVLNGGGALMDFGCYGANLIAWLMDGEKPLSVTAVTQTLKPNIYPDVDDEVTIIVTYPYRKDNSIKVAWEGLLSTSSSFTQIARRHTKTPILCHISIFISPSNSDFIPEMFYLCFTLLRNCKTNRTSWQLLFIFICGRINKKRMVNIPFI